jgi:hypothetical protein
MSGGYNRMLSSLAGHPVYHGTGLAAGLGVSPAQAELNEIYKTTPPGTAGYKTAAVQKRVQQLQERIHGTGSIVGNNGRTGWVISIFCARTDWCWKLAFQNVIVPEFLFDRSNAVFP